MKTIDYQFICMSCGKEHTIQIEVSEEQKNGIDAGVLSLKEVCKPGTFQREVFISGMCYDCQEKIFNRPAPGHEEEWGEVVGECPVCGCPTYQRDVDKDKCPQCKCTLSEESE